ncbi:MAG: dehydrogenase [Gemmatimonadetes bacterium]|nr:dehydrogenase [Gemmatimonadota bacterium]
MTTSASPRAADPSTTPQDRWFGLSADDLVLLYRTMYTSRRIDDREILLKRQNKIFFQISSAGHEAVTAAAGMALRGGHDWFFAYYRDRALCLALGMSPLETFLQATGSEDDPSSGGRQMPGHYGRPDLNLVTPSSPTGTQFNQAVGCAEGIVRASLLEIRDLDCARPVAAGDEIVLCCSGEGTTSEGEFWEALNSAAIMQLPVMFLVEDNGYAISVPVEVNTAGGDISRAVSGIPGLRVVNVDGNDPVASYGVLKEEAALMRERRTPCLIRATVTRPYSHSLSDDERLYKPPAEREAEARLDCLTTFAEYLDLEGVLAEAERKAMHAAVNEEVNEAADAALARPQPDGSKVFANVYSPDVDPTGPDFDSPPDSAYEEKTPGTMVDLLNSCLRHEMRRDPGLVVFGEDVADASREEALTEVKGKGGVFKVTFGLQREFGSVRVYNSPLAEANIVGRALGLALRGLRPVAEIQFFDYIWPAFHQLRNEVATCRWRSGGAFKCPMVVRVTYGGYLAGGGPYHSQTGAALFTHTPGIWVVCPSNALDANGLLRTAIRCDDPVMFLEHKHLYRQTYNKAPDPGPDFMIPFGRADVCETGDDVTIVTYGALVERCRKALRRLDREGIGVTADLIDLRTLNPLDMDTIAASVKRTNRLLVAYEDARSWGFGAEIAARAADELFEWLDAPVRRVASADVFVGYAPSLEKATLPQVDEISEAVLELVEY